MSDLSSTIFYLRDPRLAAHATSARPVWLFSADGTRALWANAVGAAIFGHEDVGTLAQRYFGPDADPAREIQRLAEILPTDAGSRLEKLRGFSSGLRLLLTCSCTRLPFGTEYAILVAAAEPAGPNLPLAERVRRLFAADDMIAAFAPDGALVYAGASAPTSISSKNSAVVLGLQSLAAEALTAGRASGSSERGAVSLLRLGVDASRVVVAIFSAEAVANEMPHTNFPRRRATDRPSPAETESRRDHISERRHPLRFVWKMDEDGRFSVDSEEFVALSGPAIATALGHSWNDIAATLALDPQSEVARAIASRDTWSGITIEWPVEGSTERLTVELSGLPIYDRERNYRGYRGFGVCRDVARIQALKTQRREARRAEPPVLSVATSSNVTPFPAARAEQKTALTPVEHRAFNELARELNARIKGEPIAPSDQGEKSAAEQDTPPEPAEGSVLDRIPIGVLIYQHENLLFANRAFLQWTGHASLHAFAEAGGLETLFIDAEKKNDGGDAQALLVETPGAEKRATQARLFTVTWEGDTAMALMLLAAEKTAAAALGADIGELQSILDAASDGVVVLNADGSILGCNRSAEVLFGYDGKALRGLAFDRLFVAESQPSAVDYFGKMSRNEIPALLNEGREVTGRTCHGGPIPLFMTMGRVAEAWPKFCAVFRDLTQWKKIEEELVGAREQAEKASAAKSEFLAKISHEIRTPLNAIIGFSEVMMQERFGAIGNERYREYLKDIHASGEHLLSLVNDLLDLSKIEAGKLELTFDSVNLNDLTQQSVAIMQPQANRERIIIRTSLPPGLPPIIADTRSVRQIVLNLLSNSIKFTGAGGQVIVSTALSDRGDVVLRVRDTGSGMSEKEIATALEPFRQLATSGRSNSEGTGLGLPLTKALAEANRASFAICSSVNTGTLVEVVFPANRVLAAE